MIKTGIKKLATGWHAWFTIGNQTFFLQDVDTKKEAQWYVKMMKKAFKTLR